MALTKKQMEMRRSGVGASEIAALAGLSKYATPIQIYERKMGIAPDFSSLPMDLGNLLEEPVARLYAKATGLHLVRSDTLRHATDPIALATPDRLVYGTRVTKAEAAKVKPLKLLQVKTTGWRQRSEWGREGTDEIPEDYLAQVQWEMEVADVDACDVAVLVDRDAFLIYTVRRDRDLAAGLLELAHKFWSEHVATSIPPPPDASEHYAEFLARRFPAHASDELVSLDATDPEQAQIVFAADVLRREARAADESSERAEVAKNVIKAFIGERAGIVGHFGRITWKAAKPTEHVDWKAVADAVSKEFAASSWERVAAIVAEHTALKPGSRRLLKKWSDG